jgi:hypothetical protein
MVILFIVMVGTVDFVNPFVEARQAAVVPTPIITVDQGAFISGSFTNLNDVLVAITRVGAPKARMCLADPHDLDRAELDVAPSLALEKITLDVVDV